MYYLKFIFIYIYPYLFIYKKDAHVEMMCFF